MVQGRAHTTPVGQGGWSVLIASLSASELASPPGNPLLLGDGKDAWYGWATAPRLDAPDLVAQKRIGVALQQQFSQDLPYIPLAQYLSGTAYRRGLTDVRRGFVLPLNVSRA